MKSTIAHLLLQAASKAHHTGELPSGDFPMPEIEEPRIETHGDFSTNFAMVMAKNQKMPPRKIAEAIVRHMEDRQQVLTKIEIAGPGFINLFVCPAAWHPVLKQIHESGDRYGSANIGNGKKVQVEFVSANPTGPIHVGHGRGAAVGDAVANILSFCGYDVQREYYINDAGVQMQTLGRSALLRYQELCGKTVQFPEDAYPGHYLIEIAKNMKAESAEMLEKLDETAAAAFCAEFASKRILKQIEDDLEAFGVRFDQWYSERSLYDTGKVDEIIADFKNRNLIYEKDGALWLRTSEYGDEKDRVVVKQNGEKTYFASDIAYHEEKYRRGFEWVIDVWGADHHGYIPRMTASVLASGRRKDQFTVILTNLVNLQRGGIPVAMSKRAGEFVTLKDVIDEVGKDAARFIFLTRHYESPLDFDLELAKKQTNDNPVYYVQYVHARISSIFAKGRERGIGVSHWNPDAAALLVEPEEIQLLKHLSRYPEVVAGCAASLEPHRITYYLTELAAAFHAYYNKHRVLTDDPLLMQGRLYLVLSIQKIIRNGLTLLGVSAPEKM